MGVDFFPCACCNEAICDCGEYISCNCNRRWCTLECAFKEGYVLDDNESCSFCRKEDAEDSDLLKFLMKQHKLKREKLLKMYFDKKSKKKVVKQLMYAVNDPRWKLSEWKQFIEKQIDQYGEESVMFTDGGHNNVTLMIEK